jgi:uncharacterized protein YbjT (DUF2867 family)
MILVTGATGNVGRQVVRQLVEAGQPVRALTRDPDGADLPAGVEVVRGDLTRPESLPVALDGVERAYLFPVPDAVQGFLELARDAGVRRIVVLSSAAASSPNGIGSRHLVVERAVEATDVEWTHVRPGAFAVNALWQWGASIRAEGVVRAPYGDAAVAPIHEADIAAVATTALLHAGHSGQRYELSGPESLTYREQVDVLARAIGRDIEFIELSPEQAREQMIRNVPERVVDALLGLWADAVGRSAPVSPVVEQVTGRPARTFAQWAADHADQFR